MEIREFYCGHYYDCASRRRYLIGSACVLRNFRKPDTICSEMRFNVMKRFAYPPRKMTSELSPPAVKSVRNIHWVESSNKCCSGELLRVYICANRYAAARIFGVSPSPKLPPSRRYVNKMCSRDRLLFRPFITVVERHTRGVVELLVRSYLLLCTTHTKWSLHKPTNPARRRLAGVVKGKTPIIASTRHARATM